MVSWGSFDDLTLILFGIFDSWRNVLILRLSSVSRERWIYLNAFV